MNRREMLKSVGLGVGALFGGGAVVCAMASESEPPMRSAGMTHYLARKAKKSYKTIDGKVHRYGESDYETAGFGPESEPVLFVGGCRHGDIWNWPSLHKQGKLVCEADSGPEFHVYIRSASNPVYALEESFSRVLQRPPDNSVWQVYHAEKAARKSGKYEQWAEYWKVNVKG